MNPNLAGLIAIMMWATSPLMIINSGNTPPFLMTAIALFIGSLLMFIRSLVMRHDFKAIIAQPVKAYLLTTYGIGGYIIFWFLGFKNAPAFEANTLNYLWPLLLVVFSHGLAKKRMSMPNIIGLATGFVGTCLIFNQGMGLDLSVTHLKGYAFSLLAAFIWASYSALTRYASFPNRSMLAFMLIPAIISLCIHIGFETPYIPTGKELFFLTLLGLTRISFTFWDYAMKAGKISFISSISYLVPVLSTGILMAFGYVPSNNIILISAALVIGGCLIVNYDTLKDKLKNK